MFWILKNVILSADNRGNFYLFFLEIMQLRHKCFDQGRVPVDTHTLESGPLAGLQMAERFVLFYEVG